MTHDTEQNIRRQRANGISERKNILYEETIGFKLSSRTKQNYAAILTEATT